MSISYRARSGRKRWRARAMPTAPTLGLGRLP